MSSLYSLTDEDRLVAMTTNQAADLVKVAGGESHTSSLVKPDRSSPRKTADRQIGDLRFQEVFMTVSTELITVNSNGGTRTSCLPLLGGRERMSFRVHYLLFLDVMSTLLQGKDNVTLVSRRANKSGQDTRYHVRKIREACTGVSWSSGKSNPFVRMVAPFGTSGVSQTRGNGRCSSICPGVLF
ncbi:hypothetical protein RRG08_031285 [Elysia crispata]|uniref:Uncharacterized protein n=1 Tax=Elysia crispata TaxID=231223 RepID=A0AAE1AIN9_9GAST|nr:hypothetical protein RRG08_031285 [Elysia crispata]